MAHPRRKQFLIGFLCLLVLHPSLAQQTPPRPDSAGASPPVATVTSTSPALAVQRTFWQSLSFRLGGHYGTFFANHPKLQYVQDGHTRLAELDIMTRTTGKHAWQQATHYPDIGLAFLYGQTGASVYIGHMAAVIPFMNFHLVETRHMAFNLRLGVGPAWVQKTFNAVTDYQNLVIGSHINACIDLGLSAEIYLLPQMSLDLGASFTHLSNGSAKLPNLGLNIPGLSAGLRYDISPRPARIHQSLPPVDRKWHYYFFSYIAGKQYYPIGSGVYLVNVLNIEALKDISPVSRIGGGLNFTLDRANSVEVPYSPTFAFDKSKSQWQIGVYAAYEYVIGRLSLPLQLGAYLYNNYKINTLYQNIGIKYRFAPHWTAGFALKAHLGDGDFIQWGLGYRF